MFEQCEIVTPPIPAINLAAPFCDVLIQIKARDNARFILRHRLESLRMIIINKAKLTLIAAITALGIASPTVGLAQSAYTTGTAASRERAGYPSPYGYEGLYAYVPGYGHHAARGHQRGRSGSKR